LVTGQKNLEIQGWPQMAADKRRKLGVTPPALLILWIRAEEAQQERSSFLKKRSKRLLLFGVCARRISPLSDLAERDPFGTGFLPDPFIRL
jgi:hypothetical protein